MFITADCVLLYFLLSYDGQMEFGKSSFVWL